MFDYYKAPPQAVFDEIKAKAIELWRTYDDTHGYASKKIDSIKDMENIRDNTWTIVAMFDYFNQRRLRSIVNEETGKILDELFAQNRE